MQTIEKFGRIIKIQACCSRPVIRVRVQRGEKLQVMQGLGGTRWDPVLNAVAFYITLKQILLVTVGELTARDEGQGQELETGGRETVTVVLVGDLGDLSPWRK